ncbi:MULTISPECIES: alkane 1-monooxygenase [Roseivirga]|jgi:alkane 1-monooxygenase|uniref:Alkane 1-monooxygenase n=1 Tax=Roseivirga thermotolerans TaxID=1758176 RepID=A0ABQ3IB57_9BACT|nr:MULTISPECIES: alkane 1-monooxygenase [Roseivirga]GHE67368.1 alkane 1-monooxygenase [Roseivirga thermotolerans]|tara:strand:+ start:6471 stop:7565 length:1095 start_codon:yes stop_codon:yes gene_type:complete
MSWIKKIGFLTAFIIPSLTVLGFYSGGYWNWLTVAFVFVLIPLADHLIGEDPENLSENESLLLAEQFYYRFITYVWTFFQVAFVLWACWMVASHSLDLMEWIGFTLSCALVTGGIGITVAHELGHKKSGWERFCSKLLLMTVCYMHFYIEHNRGHHVYVATPRDPATSRKNEPFYRFWIRSVFGSYFSAWKLEKERLSRRKQGFLSLRNNMLWFTVLPLIFCALIVLAATWYLQEMAWPVVVFFFGQSILAFTLLELVNYIEHYGIVRKELAPGRYEKVNPMHSWNSNHRLSNFFLFQLQRHSDHHAYAIKRYQVLKHYDESPQLPSGYPAMILLAACPPLWFRWMNPKLKAWEEEVYNAKGSG